jgi:hypothetical protein
MKEQVVAGAQDAADELGYDLVGASMSHQVSGGTIFGFAFDAQGEEASVEFVVNEPDVVRFGLTLRDYARWEIVDALRKPDDIESSVPQLDDA